jgi:prophage regulatory protein
MTQHSNPPVHAILRLQAVKQRTGLSRSSIYLHMKDGTFPRQVALGPRSVGWLEADINAWIEAKLRASGR